MATVNATTSSLNVSNAALEAQRLQELEDARLRREQVGLLHDINTKYI